MIDQFNALVASEFYSITADHRADHDSFVYFENNNVLSIKLIGPYERSTKTAEMSIRPQLQGKYILPQVL